MRTSRQLDGLEAEGGALSRDQLLEADRLPRLLQLVHVQRGVVEEEGPHPVEATEASLLVRAERVVVVL